MVALVTGATGFVGSAVIRKLLERGERVRALVRRNSDLSNVSDLDLDIVAGDLCDEASLNSAMRGVKSLYHVAADYRLWAANEKDIFETNVVGTNNILRAAIRAGVGRIVHTSSVCTLGLGGNGEVSDETAEGSRAEMIGAYKLSKYLAEQNAINFARAGAPIVIVNPSTPIGPRDIKPTPTGRMVQEAAEGKMPAFVNTGLNFVHVDDVATGHLLAHDRGCIGERYILGGYNLSLKSLLWLIADLCGRSPPKVQLPRRTIYPIALIAEAVAKVNAKEPLVTINGLRLAKRFMYFSSAKAQRELGYAFRPMRDALSDAISGFGIRLAAPPNFTSSYDASSVPAYLGTSTS